MIPSTTVEYSAEKDFLGKELHFAKMQSFAAKNKETFKSSSRNFVKPIIPFPNIVDMMSKNSKEFQPSPVDPNIIVDEKVIVKRAE